MENKIIHSQRGRTQHKLKLMCVKISFTGKHSAAGNAVVMKRNNWKKDTQLPVCKWANTLLW